MSRAFKQKISYKNTDYIEFVHESFAHYSASFCTLQNVMGALITKDQKNTILVTTEVRGHFFTGITEVLGIKLRTKGSGPCM